MVLPLLSDENFIFNLDFQLFFLNSWEILSLKVGCQVSLANFIFIPLFAYGVGGAGNYGNIYLAWGTF